MVLGSEEGPECKQDRKTPTEKFKSVELPNVLLEALKYYLHVQNVNASNSYFYFEVENEGERTLLSTDSGDI